MSFERPTLREKVGMRLEGALAGLLVAGYLRTLDLHGDERLLELGCGVGALTRHLARLLPKGQITAVDASEYWAAAARKRLRSRGNVTVFAGDVRTLDLRPETFDAALIHFVLHDIPASDRPDVLTALADLVVSGGTLYLREPTRPSHGMPPEEIREIVGNAGFAGMHDLETRSRLAGPMYDAWFRKG